MSHGVRSGFLPLILVALSLSFAMPRAAAAQTRADSAAVLLETASRFEARGRLDVADALYEHILERFGDTAAAVEVRRIRAAMPADRAARSGRVELQVWGTLYGLWLGVAVPLIADADGPEPYGLGLLLGGPAGFFASRAYARSRGISEGQARAITFGGTWGTWQGFGWGEVFDVGGGGDETQEYVASMVAGGLTGIVTGAILARNPIPAGTATAVSFGALWGTWFGVAAGVVADLDGDDLLAATLVGGNAGLITTAFIAPGWEMSRNRARLISIAGVLGGVAGAGVALLLQPDDEKVAILLPTVGSIAGLAIGATTTSDYDRGGASGGGGSGDGAALIDVRGGRVSIGSALPQPTLVRADDRPDAPLRLGVRLTLLRARF